MNPQLVGGDDWALAVVLLKEDGTAFDLTGDPQLEWVLADRSGIHVLHTADVSISVDDAAAGKITVTVPAAKTATLSGGTYRQSVRVIAGAATSTPLVAALDVLPDPFREAPSVAPLLPLPRKPNNRRVTWPK